MDGVCIWSVCVCVYSQCGVWVSKSELSVPAESAWRVDGGGDSSESQRIRARGCGSLRGRNTYRDGGG